MFCTKCGSRISDGEQFCSNCGAPVGNPALQAGQDKEPQPGKKAEAAPKRKRSKEPLAIAFLCVAALLVAGLLVVVGYGLVKTKEFREYAAVFEAIPADYAGLGKFQSEYDALSEEADNASSRFLFWKYGDLTDKMDDLASEIGRLNEAVAEYREQYEAVVKQIETDGHYMMEDYEEEYLRIKADLEAALSDFDEKHSKTYAKDFADVCAEILEGNEKKASAYVDDAQNIQASFRGYSAHPFELYMVGDLVNRIEADQEGQDFVQLQADYTQLKDWSDKFYAATQAGEQIGSFVQADVSESDTVKLYLSSADYGEYEFRLEDFMIYEKNGDAWVECEPVGISQIKGFLTMDLVVDVSSSMSDDFYTMQGAVEGFVNSTHSDTTLGLSTIGNIYERYQEFTLDKDSIIHSVWGLECYGLTSLYQSLYSSVVYTASAEGARCVVAFTDGHNVPYGSGYDYSAQDVIDVSNYYKVPVYIIGIGSNINSSDLRNIAESTGGAYYDRVSVYDLQNIYTDIYEAQGRLYEFSYRSAVSNNVNRDIYVLYADQTADLSVRLESELNAEALQEAYQTSSFRADDLSSFYTDSKYLSSDDLSKLGDDLEAVQTIINIYYAKNGYCFGSGENGQKQLAKMISLGVISENGTLDGDTVSAIIKANPVLYQNFSALYNYRYELVYSAAYDIYWNNPSISYEDLRGQVHRYFGEENETRFDPVTKAAWNAIKAG
ncbi:MAG: VWA domain-containing protein [Muribaculum sp.]|nr:VWA domain-containing protein [Muribaculum sp.]